MIFIISGIYKELFTLWLTVITVCHHQIPMYLFLHRIFWHSKAILALPDIFDYGCIYARFLNTSLAAVSLNSSPGSTVPLEAPSLRTYSYNSYKGQAPYPEILPHHHNLLLQSLQYLLMWSLPFV